MIFKKHLLNPSTEHPPRFQRLATFRLPPNFRGRPGWYVQLWWIVQSTLFAWSPQILYPWRRWLLQCFGVKGARGLMIRPTAIVTYPWKVSLGDDCWIGDNAVLYSLGEIEVGHDCVISQRSYLCAATHDYTVPSFDMVDKKITLEPEVWLAADVFVAPGVSIGRGAVVGARSSVFNDLPPAMVCAGSPAKPLKPRTMRETIVPRPANSGRLIVAHTPAHLDQPTPHPASTHEPASTDAASIHAESTQDASTHGMSSKLAPATPDASTRNPSPYPRLASQEHRF